MQKLQRFGFLCLHHGWPLLAMALVLLATVVTLLRLGLPYAEGYKTDIEQLIADRYGAKVQIGQLSAGWQSTGPALLLQQVSVQDAKGQPMLQVGETRIRLDFWGSLTSLSLKAEHFELSGLKYQLDSRQLLQQNNTEKTTSDEPLLSAVEQLLFRQLKNFTLVDSELRLKSEFTPDIVIAIQRLAWRNEGKRHQGSGEVAIHGVTTNTSAFILDLYGDSLAKSRGQLYLSSSELDVLPWFEQLLPQSKKLSRADINFQAWGDIEAGTLQQIQIKLAQNRLVWRHEGKTEQLSLGQGQLLWRPTEQGWLLSSSALTLQSGAQSWHDLQLQLAHEQGVYSGALQQFQLSAMVPLARLLAEDLSALQSILAFEADARLTQLALRLSDNGWFLGGDFIDLTSKPVDDVPGLTGLNGHFSASQDYIRLDITAQDGELRWGDAFSRATPYQQLSGQLEVLQQDGKWRLQIPRLALRHPELELDAEMVLQLGDKAGMTLLAELRAVPVADAQHYFPVRHMPQSVIDYLRPALLSGKIPHARVLWQGAFADFPYRGGEGKFQALALVDNAEFSFDANWPDIKQMRAELLFENAAMLIQSQAGSLFELQLNDGVTASIPDLFHADNLLIDIQTQTRAEGVTALMLASPLSGSVGATLDYLGVDGLVDAKVQLQIGLKEAGVIARGDVDFFANNLHIKAPAVAVEQVEGRLSFLNDQISSEQLKLVSQGIPLFASLKGAQQQDGYQLNLTAKGEHETGKLLALVAEPWQELGTGSAFFDWQLDISLPQSGFSYQSTVLIDLAAAELRLPEPFGKTPADGATVLIEAKGNQQGSDIILKYGDALRFLAKLEQDSGQISAALLSLGQTSAQLKPGFEIELDLPKADFVPWLSLIQQQISSAPAENNILPPLSLVRGKVAELHLFDDVFLHKTNFSFVPAADHWLLDLTATEAKGKLQLYHDLEQQGIKANLERLALVFADQDAKDLAAAELKAALLLDPDSTEKPDYAALEAEAFAKLTPMNWLADLPPLDLVCGQCTIGHFRLGELKLTSRSDGSSWQLNNFASNYQGHRWQISGQWQQNAQIGNSVFSGSLTSPSFGQLLSEYDISSSLTGSKAKLTFTDIGWQGAPFQFNRQTLNGALSWQFGDGSLSDVSDGGARIFSLLSLDSLVRKLRLDFRDVFSKGFFFSKMSGDMTLTDGVSYTNNTEVLGAAGDINMRGFADLKARQLDYQMSFSPKVTSSIPVILAWMVNPVSGVAAYALDEMFQSAEVISKINFTVTGDLDNPVVTEIKRDSKQITLPKPAATTPAPLLPVDPAAPVPLKRELLQDLNNEEKQQPVPLDGLRELPLMPEATPVDEQQDDNKAVEKQSVDNKPIDNKATETQPVEKQPAEKKRLDGA
ncbi:YhdP family protein [Rheinheimera sp.]|uniref:YhdP family protein n=1 Tax=Rheinheimera sp. TaxID=1869214 RepID=UPI0027BAEF41|nr:YhdP family protein [Rheinheimera sp.]